MKKDAVYLDPNASLEARVNDLLGRMTLKEKVCQTGFALGRYLIKEEKISLPLVKKHIGNKGIGGVMDPWMPARKTAKAVNEIQKYIMKNSRLPIPALIMSECLHGHLSPGATTFPQAIGLSCSWNPRLVQKIAAVAAKEASSIGISQAFSPDLDLARDPRWGRVEETYGEDPYLVSSFGRAYIQGLQGTKKKIGRDKLMATPKHFAGHCDPQGGINLGPADVGIRKLREEYLPPFKAAVDAGVMSIMPAYNEIDGIPCAASKFLLQKILREEWGFQGYTFADFGSVEMLTTFHKVAGDLKEAGKMAFEAGLDMETPMVKCYGNNLLELIKNGEITIERLDEAVGRILRVKFLAGLFENPYVKETGIEKIYHNPEHVKLARKAAHESIVLLKNKKNLLPLSRNISTIAVIGPNADTAECGDYCFPKSADVSPLEGIRKGVSKKTKVLYAQGCDIHDIDRSGFAEAVQAAKDADVAVMYMGGSSMSLGGVGWEVDGKKTRPSTCGEGFDRTDLNLSGLQQELVEAVTATGTPVIVVIISGRPLTIGWINGNVPAILQAWYPGEQGGHAIADILFGKVNPSAKLTVSMLRCVGQVPKYYCQKPSGRGIYKKPGSPGKPGRDYVYSDPSPLFDFGYGLSYTKFKYSNLKIMPGKINPDGKVTVSVNVKNVGKLKGKEIVQLYINDLVSSVTTPVKLLKGFDKIELSPGQSKSVTFVLKPEDLALLDADMNRVVEPGEFEVMVGPLKKSFTVV